MNQKKRLRVQRKRRENYQRNVNIHLLPTRLDFDAQPVLLMLQGIAGKRAEAAQWYMEIRKLYIGVIDGIDALEKMMNQQETNQKVTVDGKEVNIDPEKAARVMTYLIENSIFRLFACLDKYAQMIRVYYEYPEHGLPLIFTKCSKCGRELDKEFSMNETNCNLVSIYNILKKQPRNPKIDKTINSLYMNKNIKNLWPYRSGITHRKNIINGSVGIDPEIKSEIGLDGMKTLFTFKDLPSINWFRVEIVNGLNAIVEATRSIDIIVFPPDVTNKIKIENKVPPAYNG